VANKDPLTRAVVDWSRAQADWLSGQLAAAERSLTRSVAGYRAAGVPVQAAAVCYDLARVQYARGRLGAAIATCRDALELVTAVDADLPRLGRPACTWPSSCGSRTSWTWAWSK
jgi:MalT-like TPR region